MTNAPRYLRACLLLSSLALTLPLQGLAQSNPSQQRDGQHDFEIGTWKTHLKRSNDGGKTWEVNWIAVDTRVKE